MREIIFRGKRTDNGEWVEGYYVHDTFRTVGENNSEILNDVYAISEYMGDYHEIDPDTLGRYTGLKDKYDIKIFAGDLMIFDEELYKVEYNEGYAMFEVVCKNVVFDFGCICGCRCEVVGNQWDSKELLEDWKPTRDKRVNYA